MASKHRNKVVYVAGRDGLGNRLLTLEKACRYAYEFGMKVFVDWEDSVYEMDPLEFASNFEIANVVQDEMFTFQDFENPYPADLRLFNAYALEKLVRDSPDPRGRWSKLKFWNGFDNYRRCFLYSDNRRVAFRNGERLGLLAEKHDLLLFYCSVPEFEPERFRHVKWAKVLVDAIRNEYRHLSQQPDIGIHIRHTDKSSVNLNWAFICLERAIENSKGMPIVHVATDNSEVLGEVMHRFSSRAHLQFLDFLRGTTPLHLNNQDSSIKKLRLFEALADLWFLSQSNHFIFQADSSFSRVALALSTPHNSCIAWDFLNDN
jgi:hypothetical protein